MSESVERLTAEQKLARLKTKADEAEAKVQNAKKRAAQLRARAEREEAKMRTRADARDAATFRSQEVQRRLLLADLVLSVAKSDRDLRVTVKSLLTEADLDDESRMLVQPILAELGVAFPAG
ncbi:hypothetical protein SAMN05428997_1615 [Bosea sp. CRIB-10]|nr:hypothetical protein SAMN05428997_1615 [Bosea sp. CRIB-10]